MKVTLTRDHLNLKKGEKVEVTPERKQYWERIGLVKEKKEDEETEEKKKVKVTPKKKK